MFGKDYFRKHQRGLLFLLNTPIIRRIFRRIMYIEKDAKVTRIDPNATFWIEENGSVGFDIRTHDKYSKRLYFGFYYLWALFHWLDTKLINNIVPKWNLGFDVFPSEPLFPDAGTGNTTVDGMARRFSADSTWANLQGGAGTGTSDTSTTEIVRILADGVTDTFQEIRRLIYTIDTSGIDDSHTIDTAVFSIWCTATANDNSATDYATNIYASTPAANNDVVSADFTQLGTTAFSTAIAIGSLSTGAYNAFTFNSSGLSDISLTGITKLGARESTYDAPDSAPTWESNANMAMTFSSADNSGTTQDPKLTGTSSGTAGGGNNQAIFNKYYY